MSGARGNETRLLQIFAWLFSSGWFTRWSTRRQRADPKAKRFRNCGFTLRVTLWCMIWQRLCKGATLYEVVAHVRAGKVDGLHSGKGGKLSRRLKSNQTSAYNEARQRFPLALVLEALRVSRGRLVAWVARASSANYLPRLWLDGSTLRVLANTDLAKRFAPAHIRKRQSDWCVMRVCVAFCCRCGAALHASIASQYVSEQAMAWALMLQAAEGTLWIGDRNFGVWGVVARAVRSRQHVLVRMTRARAKALAGNARGLRSGDQILRWTPNRHTQIPEGCADTVVEGRLIQVCILRGSRQVRLWLFTTLLDRDLYPVDLLLRWYGERWGAELNFRSVKTHLAMAELFVASAAMAELEFHVGILAYNLVRALMWDGTQAESEPPARLSFCQARTQVLEWMEDWSLTGPVNPSTAPSWLRRIRVTLSQCLLPKRRKPRPSEPRMVRRRGHTKFPAFKGSRAAARAKCALLAARNDKGIQKPLSPDA